MDCTAFFAEQVQQASGDAALLHMALPPVSLTWIAGTLPLCFFVCVHGAACSASCSPLSRCSPQLGTACCCTWRCSQAAVPELHGR